MRKPSANCNLVVASYIMKKAGSRVSTTLSDDASAALREFANENKTSYSKALNFIVRHFFKLHLKP